MIEKNSSKRSLSPSPKGHPKNTQKREEEKTGSKQYKIVGKHIREVREYREKKIMKEKGMEKTKEKTLLSVEARFRERERERNN